jgi:leader peptidase (prepilin peptidase)/N-methyltransferase
MSEIILGCSIGALCGWHIPRLIEPWCQWHSRKISISVITAALFGLMVMRITDIWAYLAFCVLCTGLIALTLIDLRTHRLPREITYITLGLGGPMLLVSAFVSGDRERSLGLLLGAGGALLVMLLLYIVSKGGLGDGDVRLSPLLGAYLGWISPSALVSGFLLSFFLGAVVGVLLMIFDSADRKTALPFGPFLAVGTLVTIVLPPSVLSVLSGGL